MSKAIKITSVFPANKRLIFERLQKLETLQYIAKPYASFESNDSRLIWESGKSFSFRFRLFGFIFLGVHKIKVNEFNEDYIFTNEGNPFCPVWNHRITLNMIDENHTEYTDEVEIDAGWKTPFVHVWANAFYRHRQRKWIKLLKEL